MAWTQDDLDAIDKAIASGVEEVHYADRSVRYRSIPDLQKARQEIVNSLATANAPIVRQVRFRTTNGFNGGGPPTRGNC